MPKLLVVEDNDDLRFLCIRFFTSRGYETMGVPGKEELFDNLHSFNPDVILMDVMLGEHDGRELYKQLKESHRHIKIILVSAREDLLHSFKDCNADFAYAKPYSIKVISQKIEEWVK